MNGQRGFSLVELLVSMTVLVICVTGLTKMTVENSRINRAQQMTAQVQANARNCMSMIVHKLRSAGWDPLNADLPMVTWDPDLTDGISEIEVFADLDRNGAINGLDEQVLIRHVGDRIVWRRSNDLTQPFDVVATHISNDADGDGVTEEMFAPIFHSGPAADRILVQITARSPVPDPMTGEFIRYTVRSEVALRKTL
jgi:prepilin-type N-terminal cleavage/methylation domain-containing protein